MIRHWGSGFWPGGRNKARGVVPPDRRARENQPAPSTTSTGRARESPSAAFDWRFSFRLIVRSKLSSLTDARVGQRQQNVGQQVPQRQQSRRKDQTGD